MKIKLTTQAFICFILCVVSFIVLYYTKNDIVALISGLSCILFLGLGFGGIYTHNDSPKDIQKRIDSLQRDKPNNS